MGESSVRSDQKVIRRGRENGDERSRDALGAELSLDSVRGELSSVRKDESLKKRVEWDMPSSHLMVIGESSVQVQVQVQGELRSRGCRVRVVQGSELFTR